MPISVARRPSMATATTTRKDETFQNLPAGNSRAALFVDAQMTEFSASVSRPSNGDRSGSRTGRSPRQEEQKGSVAPTTGRLWIGRRDEGVLFGLGEVVCHLNVRPFNGNRQHALGDAEGRRV